MNWRNFFCILVHLISKLHYSLHIEGREYLVQGKTYLALPNHPSYVDPVLMFAEFNDEVQFHPLSDEKFFKRPFTRFFMKIVGAICVPDLQLHRDKQSVQQALSLTQLTVDALAAGKSMVIFPSGHVSKTGKENIGARRLTYETVCMLPDHVEILMVRTRGLESSFFSHAKKKTHVLRRHVYIHIEPMTEQLKQWAKEDKITFNKHLEEWYNQN
ncbi:MAG: 1-acyl-sn-glycerol-3-phosphate acyltransferase [Paludibacteraceae bacterium]|nr:1-acyl-sn-glycerol-3-phosphate acyltransferase [Paludibacteraceae bacterium]